MSLADAFAFGTYFRVVAKWQFGDHLFDVGHLGGVEKALVIYVVHTDGDVVGYGVREDEAVLHNGAAAVTPEMVVDV